MGGCRRLGTVDGCCRNVERALNSVNIRTGGCVVECPTTICSPPVCIVYSVYIVYIVYIVYGGQSKGGV